MFITCHNFCFINGWIYVKNWKDLSVIKRTVIGFMLIFMLLFLPEMMFLIDLGGLELVYGFVLLYINSIKQNLINFLSYVKSFLFTFSINYHKSVISHPTNFCYQILLSVMCLLFTDSIMVTK